MKKKNMIARKSIFFLTVAGAVTLFASNHNPYGAAAHMMWKGWDDPERCALTAKSGGLGWLRTGVSWNAIERKPGEWDFSRVDAMIEGLEKYGIKLLNPVGQFPKWATPPFRGNRNWSREGWSDFIHRLVERYGERMPVIEAWNEWNAGRFWPGSDPTNYVDFLKVTYKAVKEKNPNVKVSLGGTTGIPYELLETVYKLGGAKYFDILAIHPYCHPKRPEGNLDRRLEKLKVLMKKYGDEKKPIWITEMGWPSLMAQPGLDLELLRPALALANPEKKTWKIAFVPAGNEDMEFLVEKIHPYLPYGSSLDIVLHEELEETLKKEKFDAIFYPPHYYPCESVDIVRDFVRNGGTMICIGGLPMWYAVKNNAAGERVQAYDVDKAADRKKFRIGSMAWWIDKRCPKSCKMKLSSNVPSISNPDGLVCTRFFTSVNLKKGDKFIPLVEAETNGIKLVSAAVMKFDSDYKGSVIVAALPKKENGKLGNERQALRLSRALGIAFAEGIDTFFVYELRQRDRKPGDMESYFGIVNLNYAHKPAFVAYTAFISARPAGSVQSNAKWRSDDKKTYFPQWTCPDGSKAGMIWTIGKAHAKEIKFTSDKIIFSDIYGAVVRPKKTKDGYILHLNSSPIYFSGGEINFK